MDLSISFSSFLLYLQLTCSENFSRHSRRASTLLRASSRGGRNRRPRQLLRELEQRERQKSSSLASNRSLAHSTRPEQWVDPCTGYENKNGFTRRRLDERGLVCAWEKERRNNYCSYMGPIFFSLSPYQLTVPDQLAKSLELLEEALILMSSIPNAWLKNICIQWLIVEGKKRTN